MKNIQLKDVEEVSKLGLYRTILESNKKRTDFVKRVNAALKNAAVNHKILERPEGFYLDQDPAAFYKEPEQALEILLSFLTTSS